MLTQYKITFACLILSLGASAQASKPVNDEDILPQNTKVRAQNIKVRKSDLNDEKRAELDKRLFWIFEKNPNLSESSITRLIKDAYEAMGVYYDEPNDKAPAYTLGCFQ